MKMPSRPGSRVNLRSARILCYATTTRIYIFRQCIYVEVMMGLVLLYLAIGASALFVWHFYHAHKLKQRAFEILGWIESLLGVNGHIAGLKWEGASVFHVPLRLRSNTFRNASLRVQMLPRELPLNWLAGKLRNEQETLVFEADLDFAPPFTLELQSYRLFARTRKDLPPEAPGWNFEQATPFVLTTRKDWQREITGVISSLLSCPERQFLSIVFRQRSPHFSATLALDSISPDSACRSEIFDSLRELATGASAAQL